MTATARGCRRFPPRNRRLVYHRKLNRQSRYEYWGDRRCSAVVISTATAKLIYALLAQRSGQLIGIFATVNGQMQSFQWGLANAGPFFFFRLTLTTTVNKTLWYNAV
jgi:hypothetical protein